MDIDDGGQATQEFGTDNEDESSESEKDSDDDNQRNSQVSKSEGEYSDQDTAVDEPSEPEFSESETPHATPDKRNVTKRKPERLSVEEKLDSLIDTLQVMQNMMIQRGFFDQQTPRKQKGKAGKSKGKLPPDGPLESNLRTTIYHDILEKQIQENPGEILHCEIDDDPEISFKRTCERESSSSEEPIDTSDETINMDVNDQFIADCATEETKQRRDGGCMYGSLVVVPYRGENAIHEAEASKGRVNPIQGNATPPSTGFSAYYDENYKVIGTNIDPALRAKIINHEYVNFTHLILKDRVQHKDDHRLEIVNRGGLTYFVPVSDRETTGIHNFNKWEQAFRVYSNVYTSEYSHKATELIQYNQVIFSASQSFTWENVYLYDREFRLHISNFPQRSWSVILQQAWTMCLKDRICSDEANRQGNPFHKGKKEQCKCFNKGKCTAGLSCKYDH